MRRKSKSRALGNASDLQNPDGAPKMRGAIYPPGFSPNINFARREKNGGNFGNSSGLHGSEMKFTESLEITSDRPFLPQRAVANGISRVSREVDQGHQFELDDSFTNPSINRAANHSGGQLPPEEGLDGALPTAKKRKLPQQADKEGPIEDHSSMVTEAGQPSVNSPPQCVETKNEKLRTAADGQIDSEQAANLCSKLWIELERVLKRRERALKAREYRVAQSNSQKEAIEVDKKLAASLWHEGSMLREQAKAERTSMEEEARRIREAKEEMERTSTDIAVQMAELKQVQRHIEKEKAALSTLKAELDAREKLLAEREFPSCAHERLLNAMKTETEVPAANSDTYQQQQATFHFQSANAQPTRQDRAAEQPPLISSSGLGNPAASTELSSPGRGGGSGHTLTIVKAEPIGVEDERQRVAGESMLAKSQKNQRVGSSLKRKVEDMKRPQDSASTVPMSRKKSAAQKQESNMPGGKPLSFDFSLKRNNVPIEDALDEDAPGLLEQLQDKGLLEDMHVYGWTDDPSTAEAAATDFVELESVVGKLWGPSSGLGKDIIPAKGQQGSHPSNMPRYCLACLLSLIEQTKSLRRRKWPVEWGWCRRLRAFIFVFEKHNRIVMERPEYGFATYFFELVHSLPVKWQVQRLITVMSVATTGRAALLENRQLEVGRDLTSEEAGVLEDYGWNRSSGLGSLLNFCHRVVHDYNKGQDITELGNDWKQKIGKLLMDGYDQGSIVQSFPKKLQKKLEDESNDANQIPHLCIKSEPAWQSSDV